MIKLINKLTGGAMWVDESRVDEYLAAGHKKPAAVTKEPVKVIKEAVKKTRTKKDGNSK